MGRYNITGLPSPLRKKKLVCGTNISSPICTKKLLHPFRSICHVGNECVDECKPSDFECTLERTFYHPNQDCKTKPKTRWRTSTKRPNAGENRSMRQKSRYRSDERRDDHVRYPVVCDRYKNKKPETEYEAKGYRVKKRNNLRGYNNRCKGYDNTKNGKERASRPERFHVIVFPLRSIIGLVRTSAPIARDGEGDCPGEKKFFRQCKIIRDYQWQGKCNDIVEWQLSQARALAPSIRRPRRIIRNNERFHDGAVKINRVSCPSLTSPPCAISGKSSENEFMAIEYGPDFRTCIGYGA